MSLSSASFRHATAAAALLSLAFSVAAGQETRPRATIVVEPSALSLEIGETAQLSATVTDGAGNPVPDARVVFFSGNRRALTVTPGGHVSANQPGEHEVTALLPDQAFDGNWDYYSSRDPGVRASIRVSVAVPGLTDIF